MKTILKPFQYAIFDLDGTLLDSLGAWTEIDRRFFAMRNLPLPPGYADAIKTLSFTEAAHYTKAQFSLSDSPEEIVAEWKQMIQAFYENEVTLKPFAKEYLLSLSGRGVKLAVATSSRRELFLPALKRHGIDAYFSAFVTSEDVGCGKSSPDIYLEAARQLGASPQDCAVFEDARTAVKTAHGAGFYTVAVFDEYSAHEQRQLKESSDYFLRSYEEIL